MPRFRDEWVIDRVLIDYVSGGACACCGLTHNLFLPNGTADWIAAMTDFDTDHVRTATAGLVKHPWPSAVQDQIWADRVRLRHYMKKEIPHYRTLFQQQQQQQLEVFNKWCRENISVLQSIIVMPRAEIMQILSQKYKLHSAFGVLACAVIEQIACFALTEYPPDSSSSSSKDPSEFAFEQHLVYKEGFTIDFMIDAQSGTFNEQALEALLARIQALGRPKLLEKNSTKSCSNNGSSDDDDDDTEEEEDDDKVERKHKTSMSKPEFQSDRRIIRLMIARYFADALQKRFLEDMTPKQS